jgi:3-oxoacyl-[acyl-carrier-protein] synthase II
MGIISPIGNSIKDFLYSLKKGKCGIDYITSFDTSDLKVKIAAQVKDFNIEAYMTKNEARRMDLYTRYALSAAIQAVDDSGITDNIHSERLGVYIGSGIGGMDTFVEQTANYLNGGSKRVSPFFIPMMIGNIAAGTVAIKFNARGPCLPIVTACATSSHTIGEAFRAIKFGFADAIIAGGSEAAVNPVSIAGFTNCMALTTRNIPLESSIPFDKNRDGFVMGEGAGILILEEYEHAVSRGANIYAEIMGYGNTCDAYHITAPHPEAEGASKAIETALREADYDGSSSIYVNAHGTSTPMNDKVETLAFKKVFKEKAYDLHISSTKSMTGHMLGAAGAAEAIASILALKHGFIPPTIGYKEKDEFCDLDYTPNASLEYQADMAISTSLGFGGHNAALVLKKVV